MTPLSRSEDVTASRALAELARAAGAGLGPGERFELQSPSAEGRVPIEALDWIVLAAEQHDLPLRVVEAAPAELGAWLRREVALLTTLEPGEADGQRTWLVLQAEGKDTARATRIVGADVQVESVDIASMGETLALGEPTRRWAAIEPGHVAASVATPSVEPLTPGRRLLRLVQVDRRDLISVALFAVAVGVLLLATPVAVQALVNFVALGGAIPPLIVVVALLFLGLGFAGVFTAFQTWVVEMLQRRLFVRTVADLAARLPRVALSAGDERYGPELVNRFFDLETIQKRGSFLLLDGVSVLLSVMVGLIVLAFYHPLLLAFDILLLAIIALIVLGPIRRGVLSAKAESTAKYEVAAWLEEIARNPLLFKSDGITKFVFERSDRLARRYIDTRARHFRIAFGQGVAAVALQVVASTTLLGIGGLLVIQGSLTLGQLVAAEIILTLVLSSVAKIGKHLEAYYDLMAASHKLGMLLDVPIERASGEHHLPEPGTRGIDVELRSVGWASSGTTPLFSDLSMRAGAGERIGIRGPSGSGKSMLLQLLWGLRSPTGGAIRIDGRELRELSLDSLRRTATLISRVEVFEGTVHENVHLARPFVSNEDVRSALRAVGLLEDLERLPKGVDTPLSSDGRPLSMGQRVRLQVARAIASRPRLLLVSDIFEELNEDERQLVFDALFDPAAPWTLVLASNSNEVLGRCGRSYLLENGRLTEESSPASIGA